MEERGKPDGRSTLREIFAAMRTADLGAPEKVLWCLYRSYDGGAGAWPGDEALAAHMGKKVRSVESYRARLIDSGFLLKEFRGPKPAVYRAVLPQEAPQDLATLDAISPAESCDTKAEAPQEAPQEEVSRTGRLFAHRQGNAREVRARQARRPTHHRPAKNERRRAARSR